MWTLRESSGRIQSELISVFPLRREMGLLFLFIILNSFIARYICVLFVTFKETEGLGWRRNQVKSISSTIWEGRLQRLEARRCEQHFSAWLGSWQHMSIFTCFSLGPNFSLKPRYCFHNQKIPGNIFMCKWPVPHCSHWERFPLGSLTFWELTRGQETQDSLPLSWHPWIRHFCGQRDTGLRDSLHEALQLCLCPSPGPLALLSPPALYLSLGPEPPWAAKCLQENRAWDLENELQSPKAVKTGCHPRMRGQIQDAPTKERKARVWSPQQISTPIFFHVWGRTQHSLPTLWSEIRRWLPGSPALPSPASPTHACCLWQAPPGCLCPPL